MTIRMLLAGRISFDGVTSNSLEDQRAKLLAYAGSAGAEVVGEAFDSSVSGEVDLPDRPELGQWLTTDGRDKWDRLVVAKQDRLSRSDIHFMAFVFKIIEWGKELVVLDDPNLDLLTPEGRAIAHVKAIGPARELEEIKKRCRNRDDIRRYTPSWHGGTPPYGYTTVTAEYENENGDTKKRQVLALHVYRATVLHEIRRWLVNEDETFMGACARLNERGELSPKDAWCKERKITRRDKRTGKIKPPVKWSVTGLKRTISSQACLGVKLYQGKPLTNRDGSPLIIADPVFDADEWETLQTVIAKRSNERSRTNGTSPLLGVAFCGECQGPAYRAIMEDKRNTDTYVYSYYRCSACRTTIKAEDAEEIVSETFLDQRGDQYATHKVYIPATNVQKELDDTDRRIARLREDRELGAYDDDPSYYAETMKKYTARRNELREQPQRVAQWEEKPLEQTYRQMFEAGDLATRRKLLVDAGVKLWVYRGGSWHVYIPDRSVPMGEDSRSLAEGSAAL